MSEQKALRIKVELPKLMEMIEKNRFIQYDIIIVPTSFGGFFRFRDREAEEQIQGPWLPLPSWNSGDELTAMLKFLRAELSVAEWIENHREIDNSPALFIDQRDTLRHNWSVWKSTSLFEISKKWERRIQEGHLQEVFFDAGHADHDYSGYPSFPVITV